MARSLRIQVESMRQKRRQKVQQMIQTIPVKMLFPMVLCIFPQLLMIILGPACINIWTQLIKR
jgi:tight adherence protein C